MQTSAKNLSVSYADEGLKRVYTWWVCGAIFVVQIAMWMLPVSPSPKLHSVLVLAAFVTWFHPLLRDAWPVFFKLSDKPVLRLDDEGISLTGEARGSWPWADIGRLWLIDQGGKPMIMLRPKSDSSWPLADEAAAPIFYSRPYAAGPYAGVINGQVLALASASVYTMLSRHLGPGTPRSFAGMPGWQWGDQPPPRFSGRPITVRVRAMPALIEAGKAAIRLAGAIALLVTIHNWGAWDKPDDIHVLMIQNYGFTGLKLAVIGVVVITVLLGFLSAMALAAHLVQALLRPKALIVDADGIWFPGIKAKRLAWDNVAHVQLLSGERGHLTLILPYKPGLHRNQPPQSPHWPGFGWRRVHRLMIDPDRDTFRIPLSRLDATGEEIAQSFAREE